MDLPPTKRSRWKLKVLLVFCPFSCSWSSSLHFGLVVLCTKALGWQNWTFALRGHVPPLFFFAFLPYVTIFISPPLTKRVISSYCFSDSLFIVTYHLWPLSRLPLEHKRDADAAGLIWPRSSTRTPLSTSLPDDASSSAVPLNPPPHETSIAPEALASPPAGDDSVTTSGMHSTGPQPGTPFPDPEHRHPPPHPQGRFSERLVHQIHFKISTHSNNTRELFVEETPATGISRTRDPKHFFYAMSGQWEWSKRTANYWRHHFGLPLCHGTNPFQDNFTQNTEPSITPTPQPTIAALATQLPERLLAPLASGELGDQWRMVQRMTFSDAFQTLMTAQSTSPEDIGWRPVAFALEQSAPFSVS